MNRSELLKQLDITEESITEQKMEPYEKLFCVAILTQGSKIAAEILKEYNTLKKLMETRP